MTPYERLVAALGAHGSKHRGKNWQCPSHDDRTPSLSIDPSVDLETGAPSVLLHCQAGCPYDEVLAAVGLDPSDLFPGSGQMALFPKSRYSPVGVDVLRQLPPSAERSFVVASALGRYVDRLGGRRHVTNQREIGAVVLEPKHRRAVEDTLDISASVLRNQTVLWRSWGVAHACSRSVLTIFVRVGSECPVCRESLPSDYPASKESLRDDSQPPSESLTDDVRRHDLETTHPGFSKELTGALEGGSLVREEIQEGALATAVAVPVRVLRGPEVLEAFRRENPERSGCLLCGARSAEVGYWGHANGCPRFYGEGSG